MAQPPLKKKTGQLSHLCPKKFLHIFCNLLRWFLPNFFSQHQAAFLGHRWRNSRSCAIYVGIPQPDFGEITEVVLSQQRSRRFKTQF